MSRKPSGTSKRVHARLTRRDIEIFLAIFESGGYMTTTQIWQEFFPHTKNPHATQMRLKKLVDDDYLRVVEQAVKREEGRLPYILALGSLSRDTLAEYGLDPKLVNIKERADESRSLFVRHNLRVTSFRILLQQACSLTGLALEWVSERELKSLKTESEITMPDGEKLKIPIPDAQFTLTTATGESAVYFVEIDMATEDIAFSSVLRQSVTLKLREYLLWEQSIHYHSRSFPGTRPLRVLLITPGKKRMANMVQAADKVIRQQLASRTDLSDEAREKMFTILAKRFRFATFDELHLETILTQPVWTMAGHSDLQILLD